MMPSVMGTLVRIHAEQKRQADSMDKLEKLFERMERIEQQEVQALQSLIQGLDDVLAKLNSREGIS